MRNLITTCAVACVFAISFTIQLQGQEGSEGPEKPNFFIDPDYDTYFIDNLDSIVQFSYPFNTDPLRTKKWEYSWNGKLRTSTNYFWEADESHYYLSGEFQFEYNLKGNPVYQSHFTNNWVSNFWLGCDMYGCGKKEWFYDEYDNQILKNQYLWSLHEKDWIIEEQWQDEYDERGNQTLEAHFNRDHYTNRWKGNYKNEYSYLPDNLLWANFVYGWNEKDQDWVFFLKILSSYPDNNTLNWTYYNFNDVDNSWDESEKRKNITEYFPEEQIEVLISKRWNYDSVKWINYTKTINHLNSKGISDQYEFYLWHPYDGYWIPMSRIDRDYDSQGRLSMEASFRWSTQDSTWLGENDNLSYFGKRTYTYNDQDKLVEFHQYDWNWQTKDWIGQTDGRIELAYNSKGEMTEEIRYNWDYSNYEWIPAIKTITDFDLSANVESQNIYIWNTNQQDFVKEKSYFYHYSSTSGIGQTLNSDLKIFPNPSDGIVNISGIIGTRDIKIYTINGRLLDSYTTDSDQINIHHLSPGVFILQIKKGDICRTEKLVKR